MVLPIRTYSAPGYSPTDPSEWNFISGPIKGWRGELPPLIYCHGSGDTALTVPQKTGQRALLRDLSQYYQIMAPDLGLQAWGNNTHVLRIEETVALMESQFGLTEPVTLVCGSMGNLGGLRYLRLHPEKVAKVACIIPALDLGDLMLRGAGSSINEAYGTIYNDGTMGPTYNPTKYADGLAPGVPVHLFTCSNDNICLPATATEFVTKRPETLRTNLGALGHTEAAVTASITPVLSWLLGN